MTTGEQSVLAVDLAQVGAGDIDRGGGKAANLGELMRSGFPVPPGFVITTTAYDRVVGATSFNTRSPLPRPGASR